MKIENNDFVSFWCSNMEPHREQRVRIILHCLPTARAFVSVPSNIPTHVKPCFSIIQRFVTISILDVVSFDFNHFIANIFNGFLIFFAGSIV